MMRPLLFRLPFAVYPPTTILATLCRLYSLRSHSRPNDGIRTFDVEHILSLLLRKRTLGCSFSIWHAYYPTHLAACFESGTMRWNYMPHYRRSELCGQVSSRPTPTSSTKQIQTKAVFIPDQVEKPNKLQTRSIFGVGQPHPRRHRLRYQRPCAAASPIMHQLFALASSNLRDKLLSGPCPLGEPDTIPTWTK